MNLSIYILTPKLRVWILLSGCIVRLLQNQNQSFMPDNVLKWPCLFWTIGEIIGVWCILCSWKNNVVYGRNRVPPLIAFIAFLGTPTHPLWDDVIYGWSLNLSFSFSLEQVHEHQDWTHHTSAAWLYHNGRRIEFLVFLQMVENVISM